MHLNLTLRKLSFPQLSEAILYKPKAVLRDISAQNIEHFEQGNETKKFKNRKEEIIKRLRRRTSSGESFERATDVVGRERLLLSIYIEHFGFAYKNWLPIFDNNIALSLLGRNGGNWHIGRKRQVALLFFTHFDKITALPILCIRLIEAFTSTNISGSKEARVSIWHNNRGDLFHLKGPGNIAKRVIDAESLPNLMKRFAIPKNGRFAEKLRQDLLLNKLKNVPFGEEDSAFAEIEKEKNESVSKGMLMGAEALRTMLRRVVKEKNGRWSGVWPRWISRFGCDPRYSRNSAQVAKWWGWATPSELRLAQQGVTGLTLSFFIKFLRNSIKGTNREEQFELRARFLLSLFEAGKIQNSRLVLNRSALQQLPQQYHDRVMVALLSSTPYQTSMICLECTDGIYIIEGTHNFGLRVFHKIFPVDAFWSDPRDIYQDSDFRISPKQCPVFIRHVKSGHWTQKFFEALRAKFHVEWDNLHF
jgi:hypothetical protein